VKTWLAGVPEAAGVKDSITTFMPLRYMVRVWLSLPATVWVMV
jgi:hypothetical protein